MNWEIEGQEGIDLQEETTPPKDYRVIFINDDFTTMDFVVDVLMHIFHKPVDEAIMLMQKIHHMGQAVVGVYSYDIAMTLASITMQSARQRGYPLNCQVEEI